MSADLLDQAEQLISPGARQWPRGAAFLARNALEEWVRGHSATLDEGLPQATMASQLLCLELCIGPGRAGRARHTWGSLSEACHHHAYELSPSPVHVSALLDEVRVLIR